MTNSTIPAEPLGDPSADVSFYRWAVPEKPIAVHLSLDLIDRLERDVLESFKAITKRGSEIGGVLVGRVESGNPATVIIDQYEPVECEYARGPLYLLSDNDKARLRETIENVQKRGGGATVAGFFRSNTRRELTLDEDDLALAEELFSDPNHVFLLVRPFAMKPSIGGFFLWENGEIHSEQTYLQFPFKRAELIKTQAQSIIGPVDKPVEAPASREPLVMPRREERAPVVPPAALKREEPRPAAPAAKREEAPPLVFKREERPPIIPSTVKRDEPAAKREERGAHPPLKREDRAVVLPPAAKREERPTGPTLVTRREEPARREAPPAPPAARKEEKKEEKKDEKPAAKREERPSITVKREEKAAPPVKREEPPAAKPEDKTLVTSEAAASAKDDAETDLGTVFRGLSFSGAAEPEKSGSHKWLYIILAIVLVLGGGGYFVYRAMNAPPPEVAQPVDTSLSLKVERSAGQLVLSWNRASAVIQTATRATLSITDGDHTEPVDLDLGQLRTGSIVYSPMTNDVSFRLEVTDMKNGKSVGESVRVLAGRPSPTVSAPQPAPAKPAPGSGEKPASSLQPGATAPGEAREQPKVVAGTAVTAAPPKPESLAARLRAADPQELPAPPVLEGGSSNAINASAPATSAPVVAPPPSQPSQAQAPKPAAPAPAARATQNTPPAAAMRQGGQAVEARLVRRVAPVYPPLARQTRVSGIVRVRAVIGKDGKVKHVTALSGPPLLRQSAVETVARWLYNPAMLNGEPVESDTQVDVNFML
jgi:TonB family protein